MRSGGGHTTKGGSLLLSLGPRTTTMQSTVTTPPHTPSIPSSKRDSVTARLGPPHRQQPGEMLEPPPCLVTLHAQQQASRWLAIAMLALAVVEGVPAFVWRYRWQWRLSLSSPLSITVAVCVCVSLCGYVRAYVFEDCGSPRTNARKGNNVDGAGDSLPG